MGKVFLGDVAKERKETCKGSKNGYPIVGLEHLTPEEITLSAWEEDKENSFSKLFHEGDILFGRRRAYLKKAAVAPFDGICSGDITVIEAIPERILPELLPFIIQNDALFDFAINRSAGSLSPRVKWEHLKNYEFALPDIEKQRELAKMLWAMDATKNSYQKLLLKTDELVKAQFIEMFGDPDNNIHGWELSTIREVVTDVRYGTSKPAVEDGEYVYLRMNNITYDGHLNLLDTKRIDIPDSELEKCVVRRGDILFNRTNSRELVGKTCVFDLDTPMVIAGYIIRVRLNERIVPEYLSTTLNTDSYKKLLRQICKGAIGQANINAQEFQDIRILVPPIELQNTFLSFLKAADKSKFELEQALVELMATYKKIISENLG